MYQAKSFAKVAIDNDDEEDKEVARKKVAALKKTLRKLKDQVIKEGEAE